MAKAGQLAVTVQTAAPAARAGGSPWAGMSGAALFAGPFLDTFRMDYLTALENLIIDLRTLGLDGEAEEYDGELAWVRDRPG